MTRFLSMIFLAISFNLSAQISRVQDLQEALTDGGYVYGSYCGIAGQHPPQRILLEDMITHRDQNGVLSWLSSDNKVLQTYAAEAILRWKSDPELIWSVKDMNKVERLTKSGDEINTCSGCFYQKTSIKEALQQTLDLISDSQDIRYE